MIMGIDPGAPGGDWGAVGMATNTLHPDIADGMARYALSAEEKIRSTEVAALSSCATPLRVGLFVLWGERVPEFRLDDIGVWTGINARRKATMTIHVKVLGETRGATYESNEGRIYSVAIPGHLKIKHLAEGYPNREIEVRRLLYMADADLRRLFGYDR